MNATTSEAVQRHQFVTGVAASSNPALLAAAARDMLERGGIFASLRGLDAYAAWYKKVARQPGSHLGAALGDPDWWIDGLDRLAQLRREQLDELSRALGSQAQQPCKVVSLWISRAPA